MQVVEGSAVMPLSQNETWDLFFGDQMRRLVELHPTVAAVEDYQMRPDGTPCYTMVVKFGPLPMRVTSDYSVYEPPHRTVNRVLDSPLGGTAYFTFEPVAGGTRVTQRWEVEPQNPLVGRLLPVTRPLLAWSMQRDLDALVKRVTSQEEDGQRQAATSGAGMAQALGWVGIGAGLVAIVAPVPAISAFGMGERPTLGRLLGARDLVLGVGTLWGQNTAGWVRARGIADALDGALLLGGAATGAFRRDRALLSAVAAVGLSVLSFWLARRLEH